MLTEPQVPVSAARRVLLVEDEYFIANDMAREFAAQGLAVVGPVGRLSEAMALIEGDTQIDAAVLDINLHDEMAYALADKLMQRGVPFVFATGYDRKMIPDRFAHVQRCEKPIDAGQVASSLFG